MPQPTVILDTCVLLNLLASNEAENILRAFAHENLICEAVVNETLYLRADSQEEESFETVQIDALVNAGLLRICTIETSREASLYVSYASQIRDDGEAMSIAIAEARGYKLATDDRKARRVFLTASGDASLLFYTSDLVRHWAEGEAIAAERLKAALVAIRKRATFFPPGRDPNHFWWMNALNS